MTILALLCLLASIVSLLLGEYVYTRNPRNRLNRMFFLFSLATAYWGFTAFGFRQSETSEIAYTWLKVGAFWPIAIALLPHFILVFTQRGEILKKKFTYFLMYAPAIFFSILDLASDLMTGYPVRKQWGWDHMITGNRLFFDMSTGWAALVAFVSVYLCLRYYFSKPPSKAKQQAKYVMIGLGIPIIVGLFISVTDVLFQMKIPDLTVPSYALGCLFISYAILRYKLFELNPATAADNIIAVMPDIFLLVSPSGTIMATNQSTVTSLRYEEKELVGQDIDVILPEEEKDSFKKEVFQKLQTDSIINDFETAFASKPGERIPISLCASAVRDENGELQGTVYLGRNITERKRAENQIKEALREKEVLLKEIHHRVKNNMQIISSLLYFESRYLTDEKTLNILENCQNRIQSMALIHERLYESRDTATVDFREYTTKLMEDLTRSYGLNSQRIKLITAIDSISLGIDTAIYCGLMINELVSNSLKYAFPNGRSGEIKVIFRSVDGEIELIVSDNGVGIQESVNLRDLRTLGLQLVTMLAEDQLHGTVNLKRPGGTEFQIRFKNPQQ